VLARREPGLPAPIQVCDALACNTVPACGTEVAHCNTQYPESGFILSTNMIRLQ
jgi:hypothetical protein